MFEMGTLKKVADNKSANIVAKRLIYKAEITANLYVFLKLIFIF